MSKNDKQKKPRNDQAKNSKNVSDYQAEKTRKPDIIVPKRKK